MSNDDPIKSIDRKSVRRWRIALVLSVLYVLSMGPANRLVGNDAISVPFVVVYFPLLILSRLFPPVREFLAWYCHLWVA
jgi:hypothetical protein